MSEVKTPSNCKKILNVFITDEGAVRFIFEPGAEEMIEAFQLHDLFGDCVAEFGENFRFKNRNNMLRQDSDTSRIIIPKGARF